MMADGNVNNRSELYLSYGFIFTGPQEIHFRKYRLFGIRWIADPAHQHGDGRGNKVI